MILELKQKKNSVFLTSGVMTLNRKCIELIRRLLEILRLRSTVENIPYSFNEWNIKCAHFCPKFKKRQDKTRHAMYLFISMKRQEFITKWMCSINNIVDIANVFCSNFQTVTSVDEQKHMIIIYVDINCCRRMNGRIKSTQFRCQAR